MALIKKDTVDQIIQQADIVEVVSDFVTLKKKGQNLWAPCPFHHEKSPSFSVSPSKGIYKCFGCGKAGDAVQFIKDIEGVGYVEALRYLARKYAIEIEEEKTSEAVQEQSVKDSLYILSDFAKNFFQDLLLHHEQGKTIGLPYLKERGLSSQTIKKFELGFSLDAWDAFTTKALQQGYQLKFLEATGLTIVKEEEQKKYDRFRGRVIFPIHNVSGRTIGFGARILKANDKSPKYLNSPESEIYHKGQVLYGLHQARQAMRMQDQCYLVEGYLDVLSLHQGGIENVVASSGTSLTEGQIKLIGRYTKNITVLYDGDAAGIKASLRGIDLILENGLNVNVVTFPTGHDPDSYIRKVGDTAFKAYLEAQAQDFISFKAQLFASESKDNPVKKAEAIREVLTSIAKIPDPIKQSVFLQQCSLIFHIEEQLLISELNKLRLAEHHSRPATPQDALSIEDEAALAAAAEAEAAEQQVPVSEQTLLQDREREIIRWMITYPERELEEGVTASQYILAQLDDTEFTSPLYARIYQLCKEKLEQGLIPSAGEFIRHEDKEIRQTVTDLISEKYELSKGWETHHILVPHESDLLQYGVEREVLRLKWRNVQVLIKESLDSLQQVTDPDETIELLKVIRTLKEFEKQVAELLGIVVSR
jgi:DNA primase